MRRDKEATMTPTIANVWIDTVTRVKYTIDDMMTILRHFFMSNEDDEDYYMGADGCWGSAIIIKWIKLIIFTSVQNEK